MNSRLIKKYNAGERVQALLAILSVGLMCVAQPVAAYASDSVVDALTSGKVIANLRLRFENVSQTGFASDAKAVTARARFGYQTGEYQGLSILGEFDGTVDVGTLNHNSTVNGNVAFPVIADPESFRVNQIHVKFTGIPETVVKVGRQRIILDDSRFVGNVGWRQNEQTYDSALASNTSLPDTKITYGYVWRVNRIFGSQSPIGVFNTDSHLINATYSGFEAIKITAFAYLLDIMQAPGLSSATYGVRASGKIKANDELSFPFAGSYAHQSDFGNNPASYSENYYSIEGGASWRGFTVKAGFEALGSNGINSFVTPFATLHKFQGWADVFLATPAAGVNDLFFGGSWKSNGDVLPKGVTAAVWYHDFDANSGSLDMGHEIDAVIVVPFLERFKALAKFASYTGNGFAADRDKFWLSLEFNY